MDSVWLDIVVALSVVGLLVRPLLDIVHELGHALAALRYTSRPVAVTVGSWPHHPWRREIGRLTIDVVPDPVGAVCEPDMSGVLPRESFAIVLAGPAASLLAAIVVAPFTLATEAGSLGFWILAATAASAAFDAVRNLVPTLDADGPSDGYLARDAYRAGLHSAEPIVPQRTMTPRAQQLIWTASARSEAENCGYTGTEHLALAVLAEERSVAARALTAAGVTPAVLAGPVTPRGPGSAEGRLTPAVMRALRHACAAAAGGLVDTEHIVLGLLEQPDGRLAQIMHRHGIEPSAVRAGLVTDVRG